MDDMDPEDDAAWIALAEEMETDSEAEEEDATEEMEAEEEQQKVLLESLDLDLCKIPNRARFILGVTRGDITLGGDLDDLVLELKRKGFAPLPKSSEKPEGGKIVTASDYEYLLHIPISSITTEKVHELYAEMSKLEEKREEVRRATPRLLWMKDLDALEVELDRIDNAKRAEVEYMEKVIRNMHSKRVSERKKPAKKDIQPLKRITNIDLEQKKSSRKQILVGMCEVKQEPAAAAASDG